MAKRYQITVNEQEYQVSLKAKTADSLTFTCEDQDYTVSLKAIFDSSDQSSSGSASLKNQSSIKAPMPGIVVSIAAEVGQVVKAGEALLVIEAMKMENNIAAPGAARVKAIRVKAGQEVKHHEILIELEPLA